jgi:hypothetical protein
MMLDLLAGQQPNSQIVPAEFVLRQTTARLLLDKHL